ASDDPQDQAIADFVTETLLADGAISARSFDQVIDHALLRFDFGCSAEELVWEQATVDTDGLKTDEAALHALYVRGGRLQRADGVYALAAEDVIDDSVPMTRLKDLAPRLPRTFYRWIMDPASRRLAALQQFAPDVNGRYGFFSIPGPAQGTKNRLILHVNQQEGDAFYGRSILRAAYPNWFW